MAMLWTHGVGTGRLTPQEFVAVTSTNSAKIFNIHPLKGVVQVGADADIVVWDTEATKIISKDTHHQNIDFNIFEGKKVKGLPSNTICNGELKFADGELRVKPNTGTYIKRPAFPAVFGALDKIAAKNKPIKVER